MSGNPSEYYPPRANWLSPFRTSRAQLLIFLQSTISPIKFPAGFGCSAFLLAMILPGFSIRRSGFPIIGNLIITIYFCCLAIFFVRFGYPASSICFSAMLSLHVTSICFLIRYFDWKFMTRIVSSLAILISVCFLIYLPARHLIEKFAQPLRTRTQVIVVNHAVSPKNLARGNWIAYAVSGSRRSFENSQAHGTIILQDGFGLGKITALPGETVSFFKTNFLVNGVSFPREPQMPNDGELVVPENHWFIWPDLAMNIQGAAAGMYAEELLKNRSLVSETNFVGVPFKHWFFRKQIL